MHSCQDIRQVEYDITVVYPMQCMAFDRQVILYLSNAWHWTDIKSLVCLFVHLSEIPITHDSDRSFLSYLLQIWTVGLTSDIEVYV